VKGVGGESLEKESVGTGTGEQYVKSTGFKGDGGDVDAKNPGAGREADRKFSLVLFYLLILVNLKSDAN
jgi:hypothetical protein